MSLFCVCVTVFSPADPCGRIWQVHVQSSQQQIYIVDPQIYTQRDGSEAPNTHLEQSMQKYINIKVNFLSQLLQALEQKRR